MTPDNSIDGISGALRQHYEAAFEQHGPVPEGVDWGSDTWKTDLRYEIMLSGFDRGTVEPPTVLDVGCGFGGLRLYAAQRGISIAYTGIDIATNMVEWAVANVPEAEFIVGDYLRTDFSGRRFDFIVCNGILTQKLDVGLREMDAYADRLLTTMFSQCRVGIGFNMMSASSANYLAPNLYYRHPADMVSYCVARLSNQIRLNTSYGLYEFTIHAYKKALS